MPPQKRSLIPGQHSHINAFETVFPRCRNIQTADYIQAGRFTRSAGTHDRDEVTCVYAQIYSAYGLHSRKTLPIYLAYPGELDDGSFAPDKRLS